MLRKKIMNLILATSIISSNLNSVVQAAVIIKNQDNQDNIDANKVKAKENFKFDKSTGTITRYTGTEPNVEIPSKIDGVPVKIIGEMAFAKSKNLKKVILPDTIETIGKYAFHNCSNLTGIDNLGNVTKIESGTFLNCSSLKSIEISSNIMYIDETAFNGCGNLLNINVNKNNQNYESKDGVLFNKGITKLIRYPEGKAKEKYSIPNSVITIEDGAFFSCNNLENITIPESVQAIEENAFYNCIGLENIIIPSKVKSLKNNTFNGCSKLKSVELTGELTSIGYDVFHGCDNLEVVKIPGTITITENHTFYGESRLKSLESDEGTRVFIDHNGITKCDSTEMLLRSSGIGSHAKIEKSAEDSSSKIDKSNSTTDKKSKNKARMLNPTMVGISDLTEWKTDSDFKDNCVTIKGIKFRLTDANNKCVSVNDVVGEIDSKLILPSKIVCNDEVYNVTDIRGWAMQNTDNLTSIVIPGSIKSIGVEALSLCDNLTSIEIQEGVESIGYDAFRECPNLVSIQIPSSVKSI
ncbi:Leucine rich repeat-containing protein, partial [Clostridium cavendishii DSM 21758]